MRAHEMQVPNYPVQAWLTAQYKQAAIAQRRPDLIPLWSGQSAALIRHRNARELMKALIEQTETVLSSASS
jgi:nitronate monooxygenase